MPAPPPLPLPQIHAVYAGCQLAQRSSGVVCRARQATPPFSRRGARAQSTDAYPVGPAGHLAQRLWRRARGANAQLHCGERARQAAAGAATASRYGAGGVGGFTAQAIRRTRRAAQKRRLHAPLILGASPDAGWGIKPLFSVRPFAGALALAARRESAAQIAQIQGRILVPNLEPRYGPKFGTKIWSQIWDHILVPYLEPRCGPKFATTFPPTSCDCQ